MSGRPNRAQADQRNHVETVQACCMVITESVQMVELRVVQAMRRTQLVTSVLEPVLDEVATVKAELDVIRDEISQVKDGRLPGIPEQCGTCLGIAGSLPSAAQRRSSLVSSK